MGGFGVICGGGCTKWIGCRATRRCGRVSGPGSCECLAPGLPAAVPRTTARQGAEAVCAVYGHHYLLSLDGTGFFASGAVRCKYCCERRRLAAVAANIESLLLQHASALRETVARMVGEIVRCRQRLRPGRSYERRSRKPVGKWQRRRGAPAPATR